MKKIVIVSATEFEIKEFKEKAESIKDERFEFLITGVGMVETTFNLTQWFYSKPEFIKNPNFYLLNVGIAGSFREQIKTGKLYEVKQDAFSELGAEDGGNFLSIEELGFGKSTFHSNTYMELKLPEVKGITVNKVHGNENSIDKIVKRLQPDVESMEGAAVFYLAEKFSCPVQQIRCISNKVEKRNKENWQIPLAIKNLNNWLIDFFYPQ